MARKIPQKKVHDRMFFLDVFKEELREVANPNNTIPFGKMETNGEGFVFAYDPETRNIAGPMQVRQGKSAVVHIPPLPLLDPAGMAAKYAEEVKVLRPKFEVDQFALAMRFTSQQPTLDIAGQIFYVDVTIGRLWPKGDPASQGISLFEIVDRQYDHYYDDLYWFDLNQKTLEVVDVDFNKVTEIPKDIIRVKIPPPQQLDPVGYARKHGWSLIDFLQRYPVKAHHEAKVVKWQYTGIVKAIKQNLEREKSPGKESKAVDQKKVEKPRRKRGKGIK